MPDCVTTEIADAVCVLTLNTPGSRNALSLEVRTRLRELLGVALADRSVRTVILTGAGGHFSSGGQMAPVNADSPKPDGERTRVNMAITQDVVRMIVNSDKPVIGAVEGAAFGAGLSLAAACDLLVAAGNARFCASFARVGLASDAGLMWTLSQRVGAGRARDLLLTARTVNATESLEIGLIDRLAPVGEALKTARELATQIAALAPLPLAAMKRQIAGGFHSLEDVLAAEAEIQPRLTYSSDYLEGRAAFREKRPPRFTGT